MLTTVLVMAVAVSLEPFRIGMSVSMLNRPRPMLRLLAYLCGGFAMGLTVGLVVLFVFRRRLLGSTYFTLPRVQILIGATALLVAAVLAAKVFAGRFSRWRRMEPPGGGSATTDAARGQLAAGVQRLLNGRSLWVAGIAGLGIALPSVDYLAALAVILASGAAAMEQVGALLMFNVVAFALVEVPLVAYLLAPRTTRVSMGALHDWIRSRRRVEVATLVAGVGFVLISVGVAGL
jgi:Sap-like sulfolipid-1-addressing protein